ncbi:MAG: hypothetical protein WCH61_10660, partial [bacterium]
MNAGGTPPRFQRFVTMRRKWFGIVFVAALPLCGIGLRGTYHSLVELVGFSLAGALLLTTLAPADALQATWSFLVKGGFFMIPLSLCSVIG